MGRTLNFAGFDFPSDKAVIICEHVFEIEVEPKIIVHDFDGWLQCLCGDCNPNPASAKIVGLSHLINRMPSAADLPELPFGYYAMKSANRWSTYKIEDA